MLIDLVRWVWTLSLITGFALATANSRVAFEGQPHAYRHLEHRLERRFRGFPGFRPRPRPQYNAEGLASGVHPALGALVRWDNKRFQAKRFRAEERAQGRAQLQPSLPRQQPLEGKAVTDGHLIDPDIASPKWFTPPQSPTKNLAGLAPKSGKQRKKKWWKPDGEFLPKCFGCSAVSE